MQNQKIRIKKHSSLSDQDVIIGMTKRIEKELAEMNRLKRLELEFLFFQAKMDLTMLEKYRNALSNKKQFQSNQKIHAVTEIENV